MKALMIDDSGLKFSNEDVPLLAGLESRISDDFRVWRPPSFPVTIVLSYVQLSKCR